MMHGYRYWTVRNFKTLCIEETDYDSPSSLLLAIIITEPVDNEMAFKYISADTRNDAARLVNASQQIALGGLPARR